MFAATDEAARIRVFESSLRPAVSVAGESDPRWTLSGRMAHWKVPGLSIAVIRHGKLAWARGYGVLQAGKPEKVDTQTVFSVGSVSKVGAAATTLRLVDAGKLDLDRNVNGYLTRWKIPDNEYTAIRPVTLRGILSHSAGLSIHGFGDFQPGAKLPSLIDTLEGRPPAEHGPVRVEYVPGARFQYSGGGTEVEELVIEEVTGQDFSQAARQYVFEPLGMARSSYENPLPPTYGNIAKAHGDEGQPRALPRGYEAMPERAASGLWTTPGDYAKLVIAFIQSYQGQAGSFLSPELAHQMMTEMGRSLVGLGPFLSGEGMERRFSHDGSNDSYKAWMEGHLGTGDGVVIFTNGSNGASLYQEVRRAVAVAEGWAPALSGHVRVSRWGGTLSAAELRERAGIYEIQSASAAMVSSDGEPPVLYRIVARDGHLYRHKNNNATGTRLIPLDAMHFVSESNPDFTLQFVRDYDGRVSGLYYRKRSVSGAVIEAKRVYAGLCATH